MFCVTVTGAVYDNISGVKWRIPRALWGTQCLWLCDACAEFNRGRTSKPKCHPEGVRGKTPPFPLKKKHEMKNSLHQNKANKETNDQKPMNYKKLYL